MNPIVSTGCLLGLTAAMSLNAATLAWYRLEGEGGLHTLAVTLPDSAGTNTGESLTFNSLYYVPVTNAYPANGLGALAFFGTERARFPDPGVSAQSAFTIELLLHPFKNVRNPDRWHTVLVKHASDEAESDVTFRLDYHPHDGEFRCIWRLRGTSGNFSNAGVGALVHPAPNGWEHLAVMFETTEQRGYDYHSFLNGYTSTRAGGTDILVPALGTGPFFLGGEGSGTDGFYGLIDEIRISNQALAPPEFLIDFPTFPDAELTITPKVEVAFPTTPYDFYSLEWSPRPEGESWREVGRAVPGTGFPVTITDADGFGQQRFYRLRVYN